jgi:hypothetical protein
VSIQVDGGALENEWTPARLIPSTGIRGVEEQEARATSALLSVMHGVPDFGSSILRLAGGPRGSRRVDTYTEVRLRGQEDAEFRPDGAAVIRVPRLGRQSWLIEVKTGASRLESAQVDSYLDLARDGGFNALLTVSNQITSAPTESPVEVPVRRGRARPPHFHLSWWRVLAEAVVQLEHRGVSDPDQAWILRELIEYLDDERSGVVPFRDMGPSWARVRDGARASTLRLQDDGVRDVAERWEQLVEYLCLGLFRDLGRSVEVTSHRESRDTRLDKAVARVVEEGKLAASIRVTDAAAPVLIEADLRGRMIHTSVELSAPRDRQRARASINWFLRQLSRVDGDRQVHIDVMYPRSQRSGASLASAREDVTSLLCAADQSRLPRSFRVTASGDMARQRGRRLGDGGFIESTRRYVADFYRDVVQGLQVWRPPAPQLPAVDATDPEGAEPLSADAEHHDPEGPPPQATER